MYTVLTILHILVCTFLVLVVLLQAGKGGGMGIAFGGGGSQTVFGSTGAGNFLTRLTAICATIFFLNSMGLAYLSSQSDSGRLRELAEQKAAAKRADDAAKAKVLKEVEKARQVTPPAGAGTSSPPAAPASGAPASGAAPAAPAPATTPASAPTQTPPAPAAPGNAP